MQNVRYIQRFQNFDRAFGLLREAIEQNDVASLSMLEKEGVIQRFEYTYELAWKTIKDYLEYNGVELEEITARNVFKAAFEAKVIKDGEVFINMMLSRNMLSHTYDFKRFEEILSAVVSQYFFALRELHDFFLSKVGDYSE